MITLNVDYSEYILIIQSIVAQRNFAKKMLRGENKKSPIYFLYSSQIKKIDSLLSRFREGSL